ncbi:MAG: peroxiredoxin [Salegentibacter sp.]|uniref:peroxiredoxin n=1 Tax=Salegentibacter sp. TaxID=1903072 RepID=UPI00287014A2|nr:peroxiredoxin [Salegentibacter sp.]MDR9457762.1 peroxiredoxin [Salegentibacter sp.]
MGLKIGDQVPELSLKDEGDNEFSFRNTDKALVVYFYPKDFTPGCTKEACGFRDSYEDFRDIGAEVIGVSSDSQESHSRFKAKHQLPFFLLSDPEKKARNAFGVKSNLLGLLPGRETFVFNKAGKLIFRFNSLNSSKHIDEALKALRENLQN